MNGELQEEKSRIKIRRSQLILPALIVVSYILFFIATISNQTLLVRLFSPVTVFLAAILILSCIPPLPGFRPSLAFAAMALLIWGVADLIQLADFLQGIDSYEQGIAPMIYLFPNFCFGIGLTLFVIRKMTRTRLASYLISSLIFTVMGIIFYRRGFLMQAADAGVTVSQSAYIRIMLYLAVNIYILVMILYLVVATEKRSFEAGMLVILASIFLYIVIDFRYTFVEYLGYNPENIFMDLIYMGCMVALAFGIFDQSRNPGDMRVGESTLPGRSRHILKRVVSIGSAVLWTILFFAKILSLTEFLVLLITSMAYAIISFSEETNKLNERLLENERELSKRLEAEVEEKTRDLQNANEHLEKVSSTDLLTGLYNRRYGKRLLDELMSDDTGKRFAVYSIDLNYFKPINDNYGHDMGDRVLAVIGERLLRYKERFTAFRFGGDEFLVIQEYSDDFAVSRTADILRTVFDRKIMVDSYEFVLSASIGISRFPEDAEGMDELLRCADTAMYTVKHRSRKTDICYYEEGMLDDVSRRVSFERDLSELDPDKDFYLHYQPQIDVTDNSLTGIEVLLRFKRKGGYVAIPQTLIETAEDTGLMVKFGDWIIERAIAQISDWNRKYSTQHAVTINVSAIQLADQDFVPKLLAVMKKYDARPAWVNFELRESAVMDSGLRSVAVCENLHELGFRLSVDSVGLGAISPTAMMNYHIDEVKVSERVVSDIGINEHIDSNAIVSALYGFARGLGVGISASGVENELQVKILQAMGYRRMQGFYFREPVEPEFFEENYLHGVGDKSAVR